MVVPQRNFYFPAEWADNRVYCQHSLCVGLLPPHLISVYNVYFV